LAGTIYYSEMKGLHGHQWKLEVHDTQFVGAATEYIAAAPGFEWTVKEQGDPIYEAFKTASVRFYVAYNGSQAYETGFTAMLVAMQAAAEQRYFIKLSLYNGSTYSLYWAGMVDQSLIEIPDSATTAIKLEATDGLALLKDIQPGYTANFAAGGQGRLTYIIQACLAKTPLYQFLTDTDDFIATTCQWYEEQMYSGSPATTLDPMYHALLNELGLQQADNNGTPTGKQLSAYDMLKAILENTFCRIVQTNGLWNIIQVPEYRNTTFTRRFYLRTGAQSGTANQNFAHAVTVNQADIYREAGAAYTFMPPLREVTTNFEPGTGNIVPYVPLRSGFTGGVDCGKIYDNADQYYFSVNTNFNAFIISNYNHNYYIKVKLKIRLKSGSNYYYCTSAGGSYTDAVWKLGSGSTDDIWMYQRGPEVIIKSGSTPSAQNTWAFVSSAFRTAPLPAATIDSVQLIVQFTGAWYPHNDKQISGSTTNFNFFLGGKDGQCVRITPFTDNQSDGAVQSSAQNQNPAINSETVSLDLRFGDGNFNRGITSFLIEDTGTNIVGNSASWKLNGSGTAYTVNQLLANQIMAMQKTTVKRIQARIGGDFFSPIQSIKIGSDTYALHGATYTALPQNANEGWSGEWFLVSHDDADITTETTNNVSKDPGGTAVNTGWHDTNGHHTNTINKLTQFVKSAYETYTGGVIEIGDTPTVIGTDAFSHGYFKKNDTLRLVNLLTGTEQAVTLTADVPDGSTTISFLPFTAADDFGIGTVIAQDRYKKVVDTLRVGSALTVDNLSTTDPLINGRLFIDGSGNVKVRNDIDADFTTFVEAVGVYYPDILTNYAIRIAYHDLITGLKSDAIWDVVEALYTFPGDNADSQSFNIKPDDYQLTWSPTGITRADFSITGDGAFGYADTGYVINSGRQNDMHMAVWLGTNSITGIDMGTKTSTGSASFSQIAARATPSLYYPSINGTSSAAVSNTDSNGFYLATRSLSTTLRAYKNATEVVNTANTSFAPGPNSITIMARNFDTGPDSYSDHKVFVASVGYSMSAAQELLFKNRLQTFLMAIGSI
jgi:hypothetical protein